MCGIGMKGIESKETNRTGEQGVSIKDTDIITIIVAIASIKGII